MKLVLVGAIVLASGALPALAQGQPPTGSAGRAEATVIVRYQNERSSAHLEPVRLEGKPAVAVVFEGSKALHYYARAETAPSPDLQLNVQATADGVTFGKAVFPAWGTFVDSTGKTVEVYAGDFRVIVPVQSPPAASRNQTQVTVRIAGIACTRELCLPPFKKTLTTTLDFSQSSAWPQIAPPPPVRQATLPHSTPIYLLLAIAAGISINIMPCVLPVLPLILIRLVGQSQRSGRRIASGLAFCTGVIAFFATFALVSAVVNFATGAVLDLNSLFRYPPAVIVLFLAIVFFGLVMLDVVGLSLPSVIANRRGSGSGMAGTVGMGFFAGVLSTPCSGALLGFVLVWAQTQPLLVSSTAIVLMGVGMALPYALLVLVPSLIDRIPKPGRWMEIFKKSTGFLLFFIAAKLTLTALPKERLVNVLMYGIVFSFCAWAWGKWVDFSTPAARKWLVRSVAVAIALGAGLWLLPTPGRSAGSAIDWQPYDAQLIQEARAENRPILLDFMADWCTNCKIVEKKVYHDPEIARLLKAKGVLPIKADTTVIDYPATKDFKQVYGEAGNVPVNIILLPDGSQEKLRGIFDREQLVQILKKLPEGTAHDREERLHQDAAKEQQGTFKGGALR